MSVDDYYQAILNCMLTFDQSAPYPVDVHRIFCGNLAPMFKDELEKTYKAHLTTQSQNAYHQLTILGDAHRAATVAENSFRILCKLYSLATRMRTVSFRSQSSNPRQRELLQSIEHRHHHLPAMIHRDKIKFVGDALVIILGGIGLRKSFRVLIRTSLAFKQQQMLNSPSIGRK
jgi:hydrogenase maturation factor HypF (carbamoyltransferase family)